MRKLNYIFLLAFLTLAIESLATYDRLYDELRPLSARGIVAQTLSEKRSIEVGEDNNVANEVANKVARHMGEHHEDMDMVATGSYNGNQRSSSTEGKGTAHLTPTAHVMHHPHGVPILQTHLEPAEKLFWENYNTTTYFTVESKHRLALYWHIMTIMGSFIFLYPILLVLNNVGSSWYYLGLLVHSGLVFLGLINYSVFIKSIPDLYPGNAYNTMCWILLFLTISHLCFSILSFGYRVAKLKGLVNDKYSGLPESDADSQADSWASRPITLYDLRDSTSHSFDYNGELEDQAVLMATKTSKNSMAPESGAAVKFMNGILKIPILNNLITFFGRFSVVIFNVLNWGNFAFFLILLPAGVATFFCLGKGRAVFNLLAHFIKGGVFFVLGLITLGRYCGAFENKGWAWNHKFITFNDMKDSKWYRLQSKGLCTMEMIESCLIAFYGCTNVFLEHLSNAGDAWSAKDLQHASIAFIYIGCGFCGIITELKTASWRYNKALQNFEKYNDSSEAGKIIKAFPGFSVNLFPIFTIYWTGILMSKHEQASTLSTEIHTQWGNMFAMGTMFRFITYLYLIVVDPGKELRKPTRPFTEVLSSFALLCGGLIFMESTEPIVNAIEYRGFTSMFTLNLSLGTITLLMAWEMAIFSLRDYLRKRTEL